MPIKNPLSSPYVEPIDKKKYIGAKPYKKGIENIPIRDVITSFPIIVFVINLETDDVVDQIEFDYSKIDDKKHLGRITAWALINGYYLEIMNKKDIDKPYVEE